MKDKMPARHGGKPKAVKKARAFFTGAERSPVTAVGSKRVLHKKIKLAECSRRDFAFLEL